MKHLNKIYLLGVSGSGKTHLGKILSKKLKISLYDSDEVMFIKKFTKSRPKEKRKQLIDKISKKEKWIIDSRGSDWSREPMKKADIIIWLQPNRFIRVFRILKRYLSRKGENEESLKSVINVLKYSWGYKKNIKNTSSYLEIIKFIEKNNLKPIIIRNNNQKKRLLRDFK